MGCPGLRGCIKPRLVTRLGHHAQRIGSQYGVTRYLSSFGWVLGTEFATTCSQRPEDPTPQPVYNQPSERAARRFVEGCPKYAYNFRTAFSGRRRAQQVTSTSTPAARVLLAGCVSIVEQARGTAGCLDFAIADLIDSGRVVIFERWESQAADETFAVTAPATSKARQCSRRR
jgi:hypothetical protein